LTKNNSPADKQTKKTAQTEKLFVHQQKNAQNRKTRGKHRPKSIQSENPRKTPTPKKAKIDKIAIKTGFWGGFAVDADFTDAFSGSIEGPKIMKNRVFSINFDFSPGGGVRAQAQCFLWGLFFDKSV
jgi:hypothetical protein